MRKVYVPAAGADTDETPGLPPVIDAHTRILVLGSLPSRQSIELQEYYGNPRNAFWRIMGEIAGAGPQLDYGLRLKRLREAGIGLWDVLESAVRPGSLDARIDLHSAQCNDFRQLLGGCPSLQCIGFNGKTAARLFRQDSPAMQAVADSSVELVDLPSTSPAHAAMRVEEKCRRWSGVVACHLATS